MTTFEPIQLDEVKKPEEKAPEKDQHALVTVPTNETLLGEKKRQEAGPKPFVYVVTACAALNSILLGYDIGVMGGAMVFIQEEMHLDTIQTEVIMGSLNLVAMVGAGLSGRVSDRFGRTKTLFTASLLFLVGGVLMAISSSFTLLLLGRMITGIGVGCGLAIDPLYISEMSPPRYRGRLVSASETSINIGILLGFTSSFGFSHMHHDIGWRWMLACGCIIPFIMIFLSLFVMPETPRWLMKVQRVNRAEEILRRICNDESEVQETKEDILQSLARKDATVWELFCQPTPAIKRMLVVVLGVAIFQQTCGIEAIMYYTPFMLEEAGMGSRQNQLMVTMIMGLFKTITIVFAAILLDHGKGGRRTLLLFSTTGLTIALSTVAIGFYEDIVAFSLLGIFSFVFFFSMGLGPICWLLASEIFPLHIRATGMSVATMANRGVSSIIALSFLSLRKGVTTGGAFILFACISALSVLFTYIFVPETQHKSLEDMLSYFERITNSDPIDQDTAT